MVNDKFNNKKKDGQLLCAEGKRLLREAKIHEFNLWRMENLVMRPDISGENFSGHNLSGAYLNGVNCKGANLSYCDLAKTNLVQADLSGANLEGANLKEALLMYCDMKE
ncbi:MAG: pentapeptide repeat-containing protein, partial [Thermoproteota archaeon]|nr:pentapeptide repeat-containing protein [Thermoproteota archaeon]